MGQWPFWSETWWERSPACFPPNPTPALVTRSPLCSSALPEEWAALLQSLQPKLRLSQLPLTLCSVPLLSSTPSAPCALTLPGLSRAGLHLELSAPWQLSCPSALPCSPPFCHFPSLTTPGEKMNITT